MALTYFGATSFAQSGPEQWRLGQFELDQMSVPFSGAATGLTTYISSLTRGDAWSGDSHMFLTGWTVADANKQYPTVVQEYIGAKNGILPDSKQDYEEQVQSASSSRNNTGAQLTSPLTAQYYCPSAVYTWFTANERGDPDSVTVSDPIGEPRPITISCADATFSTSGAFADLLTQYFVTQTVDTFSSNEIVVGGKYYVNTIRRSKFLSPIIFDFGAGGFFGMSSSGTGYTAGDILSVFGTHGSGTVAVTGVGIANSITGFTTSSFNFSESETGMAGAGGSGHGAVFFAIVP